MFLFQKMPGNAFTLQSSPDRYLLRERVTGEM